MSSFSTLMHVALSLLTTSTVLLAPAILPAFPQPSLSITSGNTTGSYYAASSAIAKIFNRKSADYEIRIETVASEGSVVNVDSVVEGKAAFGIGESIILQQAAKGMGPWEGKARTGLRAVLGLHVEAVTVVAAADREIRHVGDLKGKRVNIGAPGSSSYEYGANLLELSGVNPADVTLSGHPAALASELLQKGEIDAYIYTVGHPNLSVLEASTGKRKVLLVPLDKQLIEQVTTRNPLLLPAVIPTSFYPNLERQGVVPTIGVRAVLFTRADVTEETVYRLVREVIGNFDLFRRQHPVLQDLTPREAADGGVIPLHPGATRYFREAGFAQ
ncbi:MAG: TAXI family TRAP transporter solute-binding subunit [Geobacter sp.]|nr:MAG: TAXI family TRAP transporter solute-binding subunit [Geobacter sp.]